MALIPRNPFGVDVSTFAGVDGAVGVDLLFPPLRGPAVAVEKCARRLMTPPGGNVAGPDGGYDLMALAGKRWNAVERLRVAADIEAECMREDGVISATVSDLTKTSQFAYRIRIAIATEGGVFPLVLDVDQVTATIVRADRG